MIIDVVDTPELVAEARAVLTLAFADDPVTRWLYPRPSDLLGAFPRLIDGFSRFGFEAGTARLARLTQDGWAGRGAAVWLPPGLGADDDALGAALEADVPADVLPDAGEFFERLEAFHPTGEHWFLPLIGVEPGQRNRGIGSALFTEALARVDADPCPVYLESTNPRNIPFYRRHGFTPLGEVQVGASPVMTPMLRGSGAARAHFRGP